MSLTLTLTLQMYAHKYFSWKVSLSKNSFFMNEILWICMLVNIQTIQEKLLYVDLLTQKIK